MENSNKYFMRSIRAVALIAATTISSNSMATSVWTLSSIVDSTNGDMWNLHMVSSSNTLISENITGVYLDNLSDGLVDLNYLVNNPTVLNYNVVGSAQDMSTNYSQYNYPPNILYVGGTFVDAETMTNFSVFASSSQPLYDSAFFNHMQIESSGTFLGYGRIDSDYYAEWTFSNNTVTRTALSSVPIPAAVWLFGSGLLGLVGVARRKKA